MPPSADLFLLSADLAHLRFRSTEDNNCASLSRLNHNITCLYPIILANKQTTSFAYVEPLHPPTLNHVESPFHLGFSSRLFLEAREQRNGLDRPMRKNHSESDVEARQELTEELLEYAMKESIGKVQVDL